MTVTYSGDRMAQKPQSSSAFVLARAFPGAYSPATNAQHASPFHSTPNGPDATSPHDKQRNFQRRNPLVRTENAELSSTLEEWFSPIKTSHPWMLTRDLCRSRKPKPAPRSEQNISQVAGGEVAKYQKISRVSCHPDPSRQITATNPFNPVPICTKTLSRADLLGWAATYGAFTAPFYEGFKDGVSK
ncbi:hypothetical protein PAAG_00146 [Paracoccidioides lutzii Pb01]|uniref:Uncharacterized protein n=1 Tax=Paracoccidioides lutzii (strain ATCC MYA-826 / Pb01) TaxID=502779 RepID=C1GNQ1_PARBA|nr:hypothetical protein PAAG_00146 [Paracoccidioides lutzii Pb01]EEH35823.2 hypothetical protein PAAG_00146 [Paracoccidioides lutzii Pb01]